MSTKPNNFKAFPDPTLSDPRNNCIESLNNRDNYGMDLRDYFASQQNGYEITKGWPFWMLEEVMGSKCPLNDHLGKIKWLLELDAKIQYMKADAMLKAREQQTDNEE